MDLGSFNGVAMLFQESFKVFQGSFKKVLRKCQECFKKDSKLFKDSLRGVSRKIKECF